MTAVPDTWSRKDASRFILHYHGLLHPLQQEGKSSILEYLNRVGCIQYDPLNICGRNADLVLQSRIKNYTPSLMEELLYIDRSVIDGWDKMMSIFQTEDFPCFIRTRNEISAKYQKSYPDIKKHLNAYLKAVAENGPVSSLDFKEKKKLDWAWGSTRLARAAMENLFFSGELCVHHRLNNRRYYDLKERLLPPDVVQQTDPFSSDTEYRQWHVYRRICSAGIAGFNMRDFWFGIADSNMKKIRETVDDLVEMNKILRIRIEGSDREWLTPAKSTESFLNENPSIPSDSPAVLLAPLDNLMWNRELLELVFGFHYRWEVYTPVKKRVYGHYVLPILYKGKFIGRCEPVLDRKNSKLILKGFWPEKDQDLNDEGISELRNMFSRFCRFLGAERLVTSPGIGRFYRSLLNS